MQKVFVTGASGFVGLQLVTRLKSEGISVRCLVRKRKHPGHVHPGCYLCTVSLYTI